MYFNKKQIGTIYSKKLEKKVYDIIPIANNFNNGRMTFNSKKNSHILKIRDVNLSNYCNMDVLVNNG